jgi:hypothetical protein
MKPEDQIKALAELDGALVPHTPTPEEVASGSYYQWQPAYLTSYDAIIPLIQKQPDEVITEVECYVYDKMDNALKATPAQLCEALLRATNKWKD